MQLLGCVVLVVVVAFATTASCSFIDKVKLQRLFNPEDQIDYFTDYLQGFATLLSDFNTFENEHYFVALKRYNRGLKKDFLREIQKQSRKRSRFQSDHSNTIEIDNVLENFDRCARQHAHRNRWGSRGKETSDDPNSGIINCAQDAELEVMSIIAFSINQDSSSRGATKTIKLTEKLQRIVDVSRGNAIRWPWLTDEGWTIWWILGALLCVLSITALIGLGCWVFYSHYIRSDDSWGKDNQDND